MRIEKKKLDFMDAVIEIFMISAMMLLLYVLAVIVFSL